MTSIRTLTKVAGVVILLAAAVSLYGHLPGRMTGGGSVFNGASIDSGDFDNADRITHGFEIRCGGEGGDNGNLGSDGNNIEINWKDPKPNGKLGAHKYKQDKHLDFAHCDLVPEFASPNPPEAGINWFHGRGKGVYDNRFNATIDFIFTDSGEPGGDNGADPDDTAAYCISSGVADLTNLSTCDILVAVTSGSYQFDDGGQGGTVDIVTYPFGLVLHRGNHQAHRQ
jgi:hypothetical protein